MRDYELSYEWWLIACGAAAPRRKEGLGGGPPAQDL